jgi:hypothetical protein
MKLKFDRGTILVADAPTDVDLAAAPGVRWDPRLGGHLKTGQSWTGQPRPVGAPPQASVFYRARS